MYMYTLLIITLFSVHVLLLPVLIELPPLLYITSCHQGVAMLRVSVRPVLRVLMTCFPTLSNGPSAVAHRPVALISSADRHTGFYSTQTRFYTGQGTTADLGTGQTSQSSSGASSEARRRARLLTLATAAATAALGSLYVLYRQTRVKADGAAVQQVRAAPLLLLHMYTHSLAYTVHVHTCMYMYIQKPGGHRF